MIALDLYDGINVVLDYDDYLIVIWNVIGGSPASIYTFVEAPEDNGLSIEECEIKLLEESKEGFCESGKAVEWCLNKIHEYKSPNN